MDVVQQLLEGKNRGKIVMCKDWDKSAGSYSNCEGERMETYSSIDAR